MILCVLHLKKKRGRYNYMDDEKWAKITKLAVHNGFVRAARQLTKDFGKKVAESTVRSIREQYNRLRRNSVIFEDKNFKILLDSGQHRVLIIY